MMTPYLKWAGGKSRLAEMMLSKAPDDSYNRLLEPFVGSAAFSLRAAAKMKGFVLSDANPDLIALHKQAARDPKKLIADAEKLFVNGNNNDERFRTLRNEFNNTNDTERKAVLFLYLNKHGFNGLCRYNASGKFNVPFGKMKSPKVPVQAILNFGSVFSENDFEVADFRTVMKQAKEGDLLYCDPPYAPLTKTASFANYATGGFSERDQRDLAVLAKEAAERGAVVLVSNHDTEFTREIYAGSKEISAIEVSRHVSASGGSRGKAKEIIARF